MEAIRYNAANGRLAKLCLNFTWRKLTEQNDRTMTRIIMETKELYGFQVTLGVEVMNLAFASDSVVWI